MNEIKFRAWDKVSDIMIYTPNLMLESAIKDKNAVVMQYTGLKDKNEKEIYEGDILIESFDDDWVIFQIIWIDIDDAGYKEIKSGNSNCIYDIRLNRSDSRHTIIGNIYENPKMKTKSYWIKKRIGKLLHKNT